MSQLRHVIQRFFSASAERRRLYARLEGLSSKGVQQLKTAAGRIGLLPRSDQQRVRKLFLETTNVCNADCTFCGYQYQVRETGVMPEDLFRKILVDFRRMGGEEVSFTPVVGEPLVDKHFLERVRIARELGFGVVCHTNGILLEKHGITAIVQSGLSRMFISLSGFDEQEYERIYRNKMYRKLLRGVSALLQENQRQGKPMRIVLEFRSDRSFDELLRSPDYVAHIKPYVDEATDLDYLLAFDNWGGMIKQADLTGSMVLAKGLASKPLPCAWTWQPLVTWEGRVRACACRFVAGEGDALIVGDTKNQPLEQLLKGTALNQFRARFLVSDRAALPEVCRTCTMYEPRFPSTGN